MLANRPPRGKIIVFGIAFWYPLGGVAFQFLHFLLGLKRLGYDAYYVEDSGRYVYDPGVNDFTPDASANVAAIAPLLEKHGFAGKWVFRGAYPGGRTYGMTEERLAELYRSADAFLNVTGGQELRDQHMSVPRRIYLETDPVVSQIKVEEGEATTIAQLDAHDTHFTYGENLGADDCLLPVLRYKWLPTRQPVAIDLWDHNLSADGAPYNTITTWKNKGRDIVYRGESYYWSKDREFTKFIALPTRTKGRASFELAVGVDGEARELLLSNGWRLIDSIGVSRDLDQYRQYIQRSRGEFTVAKDQNIRLRSGWFSDRSACYLAAGRPVITQETGFSNILPTGEGLFGFLTMDDILSAVEKIESDYPAACRAAKTIGHECFDAEKVIGRLMARARL